MSMHEWLQGKLKDLDLSEKQKIAEPKSKVISLSHQCILLGISRSAFYYKPVVGEKKIAIKKEIEKIYEEIPIYGGVCNKFCVNNWDYK